MTKHLQTFDSVEVLTIKAEREIDAIPSYRFGDGPITTPSQYARSGREATLMEMLFINPKYVLPTMLEQTGALKMQQFAARRVSQSRAALDSLEADPKPSFAAIDSAVNDLMFTQGYWHNIIERTRSTEYLKLRTDILPSIDIICEPGMTTWPAKLIADCPLPTGKNKSTAGFR